MCLLFQRRVPGRNVDKHKKKLAELVSKTLLLREKKLFYF